MTRAVQIAELGDQNVFTIDGDNNRVGIGSTQPTVKLDVDGVVVATAFTGDGSGLTGIAATDNIVTGTAATFTGGVNVSGASNIDVTGVVTATTFSGNITGVAATFSGDVTIGGELTYEDVTNVDSVGFATFRKGINVQGAGSTTTTLNVTGVSTFGGNVSIADSIFHTGDTDTALRFPAADTFTVETGGSERLRVSSSGDLLVGTTDDYAENVQAAFYGASNGGISLATGTSGLSRLMFSDATAGNAGTYTGSIIYSHSDDSLRFNVNGGVERMRITSTGEVKVGAAFSVGQAGVCTASSFSDSIGDVRSIPLKTESSSASYTLIASDAGKTIHVHTTTTTVVVPNSVFSAGDAVSIVNGDGSNTPTIEQGSGFSLRNTGDGSTGNRTLGVFGMATIYFTGAGVGYISGSGMT